MPFVLPLFENNNFDVSETQKTEHIISLVKERCILLTDFIPQAGFFFKPPENIDFTGIRNKWNENKNDFFEQLVQRWDQLPVWQHDTLEENFKELTSSMQIKPGEVLLPLRLMLVGGKFGPGVFDIASVIGKEETIERILTAIKTL